MESGAQNHHRYRDDVHGAGSDDVPLEPYRTSHGSLTSASPLQSSADVDEYWQGGPVYRDDDGAPARRPSTSKAQGVHQQAYGLVRASDDQAPCPPQIPPAKTPSLFGTWWLEFLTTFLAVGILAATVATVYPYSNKPQPSWPYGVQLNSVVSAYFLVFKTFVLLIITTCLGQLKWAWFRRPQPLDHITLYDNASRGVWGSFELLFFLRRRALLPYVGALLTILAVISDPFGQQLVSFYSCQIFDAAVNSTLPTTTYATAGLGAHVGAGTSSLQIGAQSSINIGIYSNDVANVSVSCPTGNCTYPLHYVTAGWCSSCEDVTDQLQIRKGSNSSNAGNNYTLPSTNLTVSNWYGESFRIGVDTTDTDDFWGLRLQAIMAMNGENVSTTPWGEQGYGAAECIFAACAKKLSGDVALGSLNENVLDTTMLLSSNFSNQGGWTSALYVPCLNDAERQTVIDMGFSLDGNSTWVNPYNLSAEATEAYNPTVNNASQTTIRPECFVQSFTTDLNSLTSYLAELFDGFVTGFYGVQGPSVLSTVFNDYKVTFSSIDDTMSRIAQSLTVWDRENAANLTNLVSGNTFRSDTCVAIGWWWLTYPVALAAATIIFLVGTAVWTRMHAASRLDWKNESLPLMFCGIERAGGGKGDGGGADQSPMGAVNDMNGVNEQAKGVKVKLDRGPNGWKFFEIKKDGALQ